MKNNPIRWRILGKTMLFIDVSNIYYSQKTLGWQIDYQKLIKYFKRETKLISAYFYSGVVSKNKERKNLKGSMSKLFPSEIKNHPAFLRGKFSKIILT